MKTYNSTNFFKHTFCEFNQVNNFNFPEKINYKSKSESQYFYTKEGVFRKSNHWGRVANCRWKLISSEKYKNQIAVIAFANWSDFYPINSSEKLFYIKIDFENKLSKIKPKKENNNQHLYSYLTAQKKVKQIQQLFKDSKWAKYYDLNINELRYQIITKFINSEKPLNEIKLEFKN